MDLNPRVSGNGSLTVQTRQARSNPRKHKERTEHESLEEKVDPPHDDHLRDHHHHLRLHARHHALHRAGVCERVGRRGGRVALRRAVLQERAALEGVGEVLRERNEVCGRDRRVGGGLPEKLGPRKSTSRV